jgi:multicomponent Na+:H+ antiporter subunit G
MMELLSGALMVVGGFFFMAGTVGLLRFPDIYCRLHALTKADNVGLGMVVLGLVLHPMGWSMRVQLVLTWALVLVAAATVCHLLARSSLRQGIAPVVGDGGRWRAVRGAEPQPRAGGEAEVESSSPGRPEVPS